MRPEYKKVAQRGPSVPAYIVTFSDMVTLLLTFFVMLLSLSTVQDTELFNKSRAAFKQHINSFGLGLLMGQKIKPDLGNVKNKYFIENPDYDATNRIIDAREENTRQSFKRIAASMKTQHSQIVAKSTSFSITNISFSPGQAQLSESAEQFLQQFAVNLEQDAGSHELKLYVLGLAGDEPSEKEQWILSSMRAQTVANFLKGLLPSRLECPVYAWGAGPGGHWVDRDSPVSQQSQILIAILRKND